MEFTIEPSAKLFSGRTFTCRVTISIFSYLSVDSQCQDRAGQSEHDMCATACGSPLEGLQVAIGIVESGHGPAANLLILILHFLYPMGKQMPPHFLGFQGFDVDDYRVALGRLVEAKQRSRYRGIRGTPDCHSVRGNHLLPFN